MGCFSAKYASNTVKTEPTPAAKTKSSRLEEDLQIIDNFFLKRAKSFIKLDLESNLLRQKRKINLKQIHNIRFD